MQINAYVASLIAAALVSGLLAVNILRQRPARGSTELACLMLAAAEWSLAIGLEASVLSLPSKLFWSAVAYVGTTTAPVFYFLFALRRTQHDQWVSPATVSCLFAIPLISTAMAATNQWHGLLWSQVTLIHSWGGVTAVYARGPWFWVNVSYAYLMLALGLSVLLWRIVTLPHLYSRQTRMFFIASLAPLVGNMVYLLSPRAVSGIDPTPIAFVLTGLLLALAIHRYRLLDLVPLGREMLFENLQDAVLFLDAQQQIVDLNPAAQRVFGLSAEAIGGSALSLASAWPDIADLLQAQKEMQREVVLGISEQRHFEVRLSFLRDGQGNLAGRLIVLHDITERKEAEQKLLAMERHVWQAQKLESLGILAGGMAHDFNNLLTAILGNIEFAALELPPHSTVRVYLDDASRAAQRVADLTRQMLAYAGRGQFMIKPVDLNELIKRMTLLLRAAVAENVALDLSLAPGLPMIMGDPTYLGQIIMSLVDNAAEAMGDAGGQISIATGVQACSDADLQKSRLEDRPAAGSFAYLEVADTGCGMDEQVQQHLFEPFYTTKLMGRGLGMAVVLGVVQAHQGAIFLQSEIGKGTTIRVLFPIAHQVDG